MGRASWRLEAGQNEPSGRGGTLERRRGGNKKLGQEDELSAGVGRAGGVLEKSGASEPQVHKAGPRGSLKCFARLFHMWIFLGKNLWFHWILQVVRGH